MKTKTDYTTPFKHYGLITVPAGTEVTHQTACGIDEKIHFVNDFAWVKTNYRDIANILIMDLSTYGIDVPKEFIATPEDEFIQEVEFWKKMFKPRTKKFLLETRKKNNAAKRPELFTGKESAQNQAIKEILNS